MSDQGAEGIFSTFLRERRLSAARPFLKGNILDVGCGSGELARYVPADNYLGIDIDMNILAEAREKFPDHEFQYATPLPNSEFDTIVALAVIEHAADPAAFLGELCLRLSNSQESAIVFTTPHPYFETFHRWGAAVGLFSRSACEEHSEMLDSARLEEMGKRVGLQVTRYERFLMGANQLVIYKRRGVE